MPADRMKPLRFRRLTAGERALAVEVFGDGLDVARVRLFALPIWTRAFVAGPGLMVWPATSAPLDFTGEPLRRQAIFVHELTHVWQAQHGVSLILAKLRAGDAASSYAYDLTDDVAFGAMNIEQQAMVVEHAFLASRGGRAPHPERLYAEASAHWRKV